MSRTPAGWSDATPLSQAVNAHQLHWQISVAANGNLYFSTDEGVKRSRFASGAYQQPELVSDVMGAAYRGMLGFIAPDESYFVFTSDQLQGHGGLDMFVGFMRGDGSWTRPANLGPGINSDRHDIYPTVTPDGLRLFFLSLRGGQFDVFWVKASFPERLRPPSASAR